MLNDITIYLDNSKVVSFKAGDFGLKQIREDILAHHITIEQPKPGRVTKLFTTTKGLHEKAKQDATHKIIQSVIKHGQGVSW